MSTRGERTQAQVLAVLRKHECPLSAYQILAELSRDNPKMAPPTVYRALAALMKQGHVHRLESLNAFVACKCDVHQRASILSICNDCGLWLKA